MESWSAGCSGSFST